MSRIFSKMCIKELLQKYGVDLAVWAHEHSYERLFPTFNRTVIPGPNPEDPYDNPGATVHITTGSAGCRERTDPFMKNIPEWSAFRFDQNQLLNGIYNYFQGHQIMDTQKCLFPILLT